MRVGDIVAAVVVTLSAVLGLLLWFAEPACGCTPLLEQSGRPTGLGGAARVVAAAQATYRREHARYAPDADALGAVALPDGIVLLEVRRRGAGYAAVLVDSGETERRQCTVVGAPPSPEGLHKFTLDCRAIAEAR